MQLFPLLTRWGATGLLIEYEDMFPYTGNIHMLAAQNAYRLVLLSASYRYSVEHSLEHYKVITPFISWKMPLLLYEMDDDIVSLECLLVASIP